MEQFNSLKAEKVCKSYGMRNVVNNVDICVSRGEVVGLLGPNGAGKTTTFYMITGMIKPLSGKIYLDKLDITSFPMYKRAIHGVGYLAQDPSVFTKLTVEDNLKLVLEMTSLDKNEQNNKLEQLLEEFSFIETN